MADLFEAGKVPQIRKIPALLRLGGLNRAIVAVEKYTRPVRLFLQHEPAAVVAQPGELLDEGVFAHVLERREPGDLGIGHAHLPRPAAARGATLTFVEDRHGVRVMSPSPCAKPAARRGRDLERQSGARLCEPQPVALPKMSRCERLIKFQADWTCPLGLRSPRFFVAAQCHQSIQA
jgi:hypothetical protein